MGGSGAGAARFRSSWTLPSPSTRHPPRTLPPSPEAVRAGVRGAPPRASRPAQIPRLESVARLHVPAVVALLEPGHALLRGPVREGVGHDATARLALQAVVADRRRRVERLLEVAGLEHV